MSLDITKRSGFVLRMMSLMAFSCMVVFAAIVVLQNEELEKLVPASTARSLAIYFAYIVAIITFNYALAVRGRNFMGWKNEAMATTGVLLLFTGAFFPFAFPRAELMEAESWIPFMSSQEEYYRADWRYAWVALLSIPFFYSAWVGIRKMPLWRQKNAEAI